jgi:hypothetical protein
VKRGKFALALLFMLAVPAVAKQPGINGHWSGTFRSKHFNKAPFTLDLDIEAADVPGHHGRKLGHLKNNSGPSYCIAGNVNLQIDRQGSKVTIAGINGTGDTITMVGTLDPTGSLMALNYVTNGSVSGKCETDDGTASLTKN